MSARAVKKAREDRKSSQARILKAAEELFGERGFDGVTTREIVERAGLSLSVLHYHWGTKEDLYTEVLRNSLRQAIKSWQDLHAHAGGDALAMADEAIDFFWDYFRVRPHLVGLLFHSYLRGHEERILEGLQRAFFGMVMGHLREAQARPAHGQDADLSVLSVVGLLLIFLLRRRAIERVLGLERGSPEFDRRMRAHLKDVVRRLLRFE